PPREVRNEQQIAYHHLRQELRVHEKARRDEQIEIEQRHQAQNPVAIEVADAFSGEFVTVILKDLAHQVAALYEEQDDEIGAEQRRYDKKDFFERRKRVVEKLKHAGGAVGNIGADAVLPDPEGMPEQHAKRCQATKDQQVVGLLWGRFGIHGLVFRPRMCRGRRNHRATLLVSGGVAVSSRTCKLWLSHRSRPDA